MSSETKYDPVNLFYTCHTPKEGYDSNKSPIIFVAGFFSTNRTWNFVKYKIAAKTKRKIYAVDIRNHGQSEYSEFFSLRHGMADIENFMKTHDIPKAIFVAHSMGSRSVMGLAFEKPELVEKLVVEDMTVTDTNDHLHKFVVRLRGFTTIVDRYIRNAPRGTTEKDLHSKILPVMKQFYPGVNESGNNKTFTLPLKKDRSGKITWDFNINSIFHYCDNPHLFLLNLTDDSKFLGKSLFLFGEKSFIKTEEDLVLKYFPNAQTYVFKAGFHIFHLELPELFTEVVSKFIEE